MKAYNQILEHYFHCYANYWQDNWTQLLSQVEFVYNTSEHVFTK
jgi:hypothetical protein